MTTFRLHGPAWTLVLASGLTSALIVHAAPQAASAPAHVASSANAGTDKAAKPRTDAAASQSGVATKKPAKQGAQSGAAPASAPMK